MHSLPVQVPRDSTQFDAFFCFSTFLLRFCRFCSIFRWERYFCPLFCFSSSSLFSHFCYLCLCKVRDLPRGLSLFLFCSYYYASLCSRDGLESLRMDGIRPDSMTSSLLYFGRIYHVSFASFSQYFMFFSLVLSLCGLLYATSIVSFCWEPIQRPQNHCGLHAFF